MGANVKVALVGIAGYGDSYVNAMLRAASEGKIDLVGAVDPMPHRSRRLDELAAQRVAIHPDLPSLYSFSQPDLVMIATPIHLHSAQTCWCLEHGSNVLCEKPLAGTVREARRTVVAERLADRFVAIGYQWCFARSVQNLKRDILAGDFGAPRQLKSMVIFPRGLDYFARNNWAGRIHTDDGQLVYDSPANNAAAHYLHNMLYVLGSAPDLSAAPLTVQAELYRANDIENYDTAAMRVMLDGDVELLFYTTHCVAARLGPIARYEFEDAVVTYEAETGSGFVARFRNGHIRKYGDPNLERDQKMWQSITAAQSGGPVLCGPRAAMPHVLCIAAAQQSTPRIGTFPPALVTREPIGEQGMVCVSPLHAALVQCYDQGILPHEHGGLDWAVKADVVHVNDGRSTPDGDPAAPETSEDVRASGAQSAGQLSV